MIRRALAVAALLLPTGAASAAELIRHETVPVEPGRRLELRPGFFVGRATIRGGDAASAGVSTNRRAIVLEAREPGRVVVTVWSLLEPDRHVDYEVDVEAPQCDEATTAVASGS